VNPTLTRDMTPEQWVAAVQGHFVRRRKGDTVYVVQGLRHHPHPRYRKEGELVLSLERVTRDDSFRAYTWAPLSDIPKFIICTVNGKELHMHEDRCCDSTPPTQVTDLAQRFDARTLKAALKARRRADAERERTQAEINAEREENQRLRQIALDSLEKQAASGDVGAAVELFRLAS